MLTLYGVTLPKGYYTSSAEIVKQLAPLDKLDSILLIRTAIVHRT